MRRYLGGLNSLHIKLGEPHSYGNDVIFASEEVLDEANIKPNKKISIEKVI
jgi:hypothetical protein